MLSPGKIAVGFVLLFAAMTLGCGDLPSTPWKTRAAPTLSVDPTSTAREGQLSVSWSIPDDNHDVGRPHNDWIGLYGIDDDAWTTAPISYQNTLGHSGTMSSGTMSFTAPSQAGR